MQVPTLEQHLDLLSKFINLAKRLEQLETQQEEWLDTATALKRLGVTRRTLELERERPGTLIVYKYEGAKGGKPVYSAKSIVAHNESKKIKRQRITD